MYRIFTILFSLIYISISAQDLLELYKKNLHPTAIDSEEKRDNVRAMLERLALYDPALIYDYIEYFNLYAEDRIAARTTMQYIQFQKNEIAKQMQEWTDNEAAIVFSRYLSYGQVPVLWTYYYYLKLEPNDKIVKADKNFVENKNYRNYIIYLYYRKAYEDYHPEADYSELLEQVLLSVRSELENAYENPYILSAEKLDFIYEYAKLNPFLFKGTPHTYIKNPFPVYLAEFLIKVSSPLYKEQSTFVTGIGSNFFELDKEHNTVFNDQPGVVLNTKFKELNRAYYTAGAGGRFKLKEYKGLFSSINIFASVGFSYYAGREYEYNSKGYTMIIEKFGNPVNPNYNLSDFRYITENYSVKLTSPLIYFSNRFVIETGVEVNYSNIYYVFRLNRNDKYYRENWYKFTEERLTKYNKDAKILESGLAVFPVITFGYQFTDNLNVTLTASTEYLVPRLEFLYTRRF